MSTEHKSVLLSIRPEWCDLIVRGKKTMEVRKNYPKHLYGKGKPFKVYIYCTKAPQQLITIFKDGEETMDGEIHRGKPVFVKFDKLLPDSVRGKTQMVIGEFICDDIRRIGPEYCIVKEDIETAIAGSCLSIKQVKEYAGWDIGMNYADMKDLYGWHISGLKIYDKPRKLQSFTGLQETRFGMMPVEIHHPPQSWRYIQEEGDV